MQVTVQVTRAELAEMECTEQELSDGVLKTLDGGVGMPDGGDLYLAGFNVDVKIVD